MAQLSTYSGLALTGSLSGPSIGNIVLAGIAEQGIQKITVHMNTDHAVVQTGMDGAVIPSWVPGESGMIDVTVWQTSTIHQEFLAAYNTLKTLALLGQLSTMFANTFFVQDSVTGASHTGTGACFVKIPDKPYDTQAGTVAWQIICCNLINE